MATPSLLFQDPGAPGVSSVPGINSMGALPMPTNSTLIRDPITGMFSANTDPQGDNASTVAANGGVVPNTQNTADAAAPTGGSGAGAPTQDPYSIFVNNLTAMLKQAQGAVSSSEANLGGAKDTLTNESVSGGTPTPFMPGIFSGSQVGGQESVEGAFQPAISSINTEMGLENTNLEDINSLAGTLASFYKPEALSPGQSLVMPDGTVVQQGHSYTPQVNPQTGLIDGFDQNTGTWASQDSSATSNADSTQQTVSNIKNGIVAGIDLSGASLNMKPWASDPNYTAEVNTLYQQVQQSQPSGIPTAPGLDAFIKSMAKSSPITGAMIMNAAATYKIDPNALAAVIGHESDFGTSGTTTLQINNPAGITGSDGKYTPFNSWTQGVNATAADLAKRIVTPGSSGSTPVGGQFSPQAQQKVAQLPTQMQQYVQAGPLGVAYIDSTRVPDAMQTSVQTLSAKNGIPYLDATDVANIKSLGTVYENVSKMNSLLTSTLSSGGNVPGIGSFLGGALDMGKTALNNVTLGNALPQLSNFNALRDVAIKAVQALAGGSGSGLRLNTGEIMASTQTLPSSTDSLQNATVKVNALLSLLNTNLAGTFPYVQGNQPGLTGGQPTGGGSVTMTGPGGTFTVPQAQVATMQQNGYSVASQ